MNEILTGNPHRILLKLSFPIIYINIASLIYGLMNAFWLNKFSLEAYAAFTFAIPIVNIFLAMSIAIHVAATAILSQAIGAGDDERKNRAGTWIIVLSFVIPMIWMFIGYLCLNHMVSYLGVTGSFAEETLAYLEIMMLDLPAAYIFQAISGIMSSHGNTKTPMRLGTYTFLLSMLLDPLLILYFHLGLPGAAISTVVSKAIFVCIGLYLLFKGKYIRIKKCQGLVKTEGKDIFRVGVPAFTNNLAETLGYVFLHSMTANYGVASLAALGIVNTLIEFIRLPARAISSAMAAIIGQNYGANNQDRVKQFLSIAMKQVIIFMIIVGALCAYFAEEILLIIFDGNEESLRNAIFYLRLQGLTIVFLGMNAVLGKFFDGTGHSELSMIQNLVRLWGIRVPMIGIFKYFNIIGSYSIWIAMVLGNIIAWVVGVVFYLSGRWKKRKFLHN